MYLPTKRCAESRRRLARLAALVVGGLLAAPAAPATAGGEVAAALRSVVADLAPRLSELGREVHTYHYATRARMGLPAEGYLAPDHPAVLPFLRAKVAQFWDLELPTAPLRGASGLWVGIDPVICRHFGGVGDGWALVRVALGRGFRFVDVRTHEDQRRLEERFSPRTVELLAAAGCPVTYPASLLTLRESRECRELAVAVLGELAVDGILLNFPRIPFPSCRPGGEPRPDGVFIVLESAALEVSPPILMTRESRAGDAAEAERRRIRALFLRAHQAGSERPPPWPELAALGEPPDLDRWMARSLLGCGEHFEDQVPVVAGARAPAGEPGLATLRGRDDDHRP